MRHCPCNGFACTALLPAILCAFTPGCSHASDFELLSVGVRARFGGQQMLGKNQAESFREYDLVHSSDGGAYGREATGADMHMVELTYRF